MMNMRNSIAFAVVLLTGIFLSPFFNGYIKGQIVQKKTPEFKYCFSDGQRSLELHVCGIGGKQLNFRLLEREEKRSFRVALQGVALLISDNEQEENEDGEAVLSQEYHYDTDSLYYSFRTDEENNSFIRVQIYDKRTEDYKRVHQYFFKRCKLNNTTDEECFLSYYTIKGLSNCSPCLYSRERNEKTNRLYSLSAIQHLSHKVLALRTEIQIWMAKNNPAFSNIV